MEKNFAPTTQKCSLSKNWSSKKTEIYDSEFVLFRKITGN
jgi:hypothetical protein